AGYEEASLRIIDLGADPGAVPGSRAGALHHVAASLLGASSQLAAELGRQAARVIPGFQAPSAPAAPRPPVAQVSVVGLSAHQLPSAKAAPRPPGSLPPGSLGAAPHGPVRQAPSALAAPRAPGALAPMVGSAHCPLPSAPAAPRAPGALGSVLRSVHQPAA
ncbi:unnamed protein product, partial [Polarella glacialis]